VRPYDPERLPTYEEIHATVRARPLAVADLRPTQEPAYDPVRLAFLLGGADLEGPDPAIHVVVCGGLWIHNGHHRWTMAQRLGQSVILGRPVELAP
jgi:hypothetical protein